MTKIRVGTRGSLLALTQTKSVVAALKRKLPKLRAEIKVIRTTGDRQQKAPVPATTRSRTDPADRDEHAPSTPLYLRRFRERQHEPKQGPQALPPLHEQSKVPLSFKFFIAAAG